MPFSGASRQMRSSLQSGHTWFSSWARAQIMTGALYGRPRWRTSAKFLPGGFYKTDYGWPTGWSSMADRRTLFASYATPGMSPLYT
jgi:hypothetical protein